MQIPRTCRYLCFSPRIRERRDDGEILASECRKNHADVNFVHNEKGVDAFLQSKPFEKAVVVFMGAGDIYLWGKRIADSFSTKGKRT